VTLVVQSAVPTADSPVILQLIHEDGSPARVLTLQPGSSVVWLAGHRIFVRAKDGSLIGVGADGSTTSLEPAGTLTGLTGLIANTDGSQWVWTSQSSDTTSQSLYIAGDRVSVRKINTFAYPTVLVPYAWTSRGIILDSLPMDYFGYRPFSTVLGALGGIQVLDPATGAIKPLGLAGCPFSDEATDGTTACFPTDAGYLVPNRHTLRVIDRNGKANDLVLSTPRFNYIGDAYFSSDGGLLTVAGATGAGAPTTIGGASPNPEMYGTDLVTTASSAIVRFGPAGTRPAMKLQSWLPDGRLVLWRPDDVGGPPGLYVLDPHGDGTGPEIAVSGTPVGYLRV
jgi:hypothetical protein